ncbi:SDR family NAD(P)-dependent oxidoreductase [Roseobacter sp. MH60115]|uniref:SDR family NAD(P)-dependent oxidoreductase n=1 Tax=Roseobacter sp. MH60115 TaxID=2785324 RepID=UPI0018A25A02|nr:SDR family NAD(P)-dependent oxidoreductase [Roseobacter sp. MH60115]
MALDNPFSMFDVTDKVALITGASGAFGAVAAQCLSGAGCKLVLAAGNATAMAEVAATCTGPVHQINARPDSETACANMVAETVQTFGQLDILVVASGMNEVARSSLSPPPVVFWATRQAIHQGRRWTG